MSKGYRWERNLLSDLVQSLASFRDMSVNVKIIFSSYVFNFSPLPSLVLDLPQV